MGVGFGRYDGAFPEKLAPLGIFPNAEAIRPLEIVVMRVPRLLCCIRPSTRASGVPGLLRLRRGANLGS